MVCLGIFAVLVLVLCFSFTYGSLHTADPCIVAMATRRMLSPGVASVNIKDNVPNEIAALAVPRNRMEFSSRKIEFPKIIHQQWKTANIPHGTIFFEVSPKVERALPRARYTHMLWTDKNGRELIKNHYPFFLEAYDSYRYGIQRADAVRYFALHFYGGLYADMDYEPIANFWDYLPRIASVSTRAYTSITKKCKIVS